MVIISLSSYVSANRHFSLNFIVFFILTKEYVHETHNGTWSVLVKSVFYRAAIYRSCRGGGIVMLYNKK